MGRIVSKEPVIRANPFSANSCTLDRSRVIAMEDRLAQLEDALAQTSLAVAGPSNAAITSHHERRIAQLEAQLQAIQHATSAGFGLPVNQQPSLPPGFPSLGRNLHCSGREPQLIADGHREKRQRSAEPEAGDFIDRGLVSEEEARTCFEAYFLGYGNQPSGPGPAISLPFAATRSRSPLLLAVITAIGARSRSRFDTFQAALSAALLEVPAPGRDVLAGELELKALVLLGVYTGNPKVLHQAAMMCYMFDLPNALIKVGQMTSAQKASLEGQRLIVQGRTFLVCWTATHFYTTAQSEFPQQNAFNISADLIHYQLDVLEQSEFPLLPADRMLRVNIEECLILREVFEQIGPAIRIQPVTCAVVLETVDSAITRLREWSRKWADAMSLVTTWGDAENVKAAIPLHHAVLNVCYYLFGRNSSWDKMERNPRNRELARLGREAALAMMRWGVESRIWLPHSMIAVYHTFINIPTSLTVLFNVSRMFPGDLPLKTVRTLLHRVLEQSNAALNAGVAPAHELERARDTKLQVLEFDRWAFELGEEEGGEAAGAAAGTGEAENGGEENGAAKGAGGEDESLGEDMSANLGALKLDLALWGSMLVEAPEL